MDAWKVVNLILMLWFWKVNFKIENNKDGDVCKLFFDSGLKFHISNRYETEWILTDSKMIRGANKFFEWYIPSWNLGHHFQ